MKQLIKIETQIIGTDEVNSVNARELWRVLEIKQQFADWIKAQINTLGLEENIDYITVHLKVNGGKFANIDYIITTDTAKHISMASRTVKGKEVRRYFIEVEKKFIETMNDDMNFYKISCWMDGHIETAKLFRERIELLQKEALVNEELVQQFNAQASELEEMKKKQRKHAEGDFEILKISREILKDDKRMNIVRSLYPSWQAMYNVKNYRMKIG